MIFKQLDELGVNKISSVQFLSQLRFRFDIDRDELATVAGIGVWQLRTVRRLIDDINYYLENKMYATNKKNANSTFNKNEPQLSLKEFTRQYFLGQRSTLLHIVEFRYSLANLGMNLRLIASELEDFTEFVRDPINQNCVDCTKIVALLEYFASATDELARNSL